MKNTGKVKPFWALATNNKIAEPGDVSPGTPLIRVFNPFRAWLPVTLGSFSDHLEDSVEIVHQLN
jgi:hypothetical protein